MSRDQETRSGNRDGGRRRRSRPRSPHRTRPEGEPSGDSPTGWLATCATRSRPRRESSTGLAGRQPNPDVPDDVLADRIRSTLGPVLKQLDLPHVHVMVTNHIALLHGDVGSAYEADVIEHAVLDISGVEGIESHLHAGLIRGDTRPSLGRSAPPAPSLALQAVLEAAAGAGASEPRVAAHAVLCRFVDRIPENERAQVLAHLPEDVEGTRRAAPPARRARRALPQLR